MAALEQMDLLQKQQARNLRNIQTAVPSLLDVDLLKSTNDKLETKVDNLSMKWKETEDQKLKIRDIVGMLRSNLGSDPSIIAQHLDSIEALTEPLPEIIEEVEEESKNEEPDDDVDMIKASEDYDDDGGSPQIIAYAD